MSAPPFIIGHRGDSAHAPENTLAAFRLALDAGAAGLEFDVQLSKDGVPVVIHDHDLRRTGRTDAAVADLTAKQLAKTDVGSWFNKKFPNRARDEYARETVPTLEQVLELTKTSDGLIYIELKCGDDNYEPLAKAVCDTIRDSPQLDRMIVKSFRLAAIPVVRCSLPEVETAALFAPEIMNFLRRRRHIIAMAREFGASQISLHHSLATKTLTMLAHEAGLPVTIWTADNPKWLEKCRDRGIRSLITNDPARMLAYQNRER